MINIMIKKIDFKKIEKIAEDNKKTILISIFIIAILLRIISFYNNSSIIHTPEYPIFLEALAEGHYDVKYWYNSRDMSNGSPGYMLPWFSTGYQLFSLPAYYLTGDSYFSMQLTSFIFGFILILLAWKFFRKDCDELTSYIHLILMTFSAIMIDFSANENAYIQVAVIYILYMMLIDQISKGKKITFFILALFLPLSLIIQTTNAILIMTFILLLIASKNIRNNLKKNLISFGLGGTIGTSVFIAFNYLSTQTILPSQIGFALEKGTQKAVTLITLIKTTTLYSLILGNQLIFAMTTVMIPLSFCGIYYILRRYNTLDQYQKDRYLNMIFLITISLGMMIIYNVKFRRLLPLTPILLYFAALTLSRLYRNRNKVLAVMMILIFIAASMKILIIPGTYTDGPSEQKKIDDYKTIVGFLDTLEKNGNGFLLDTTGGLGEILIYHTHYKYTTSSTNNLETLKDDIKIYKPKYILIFEGKEHLYTEYNILENRDRFILLINTGNETNQIYIQN